MGHILYNELIDFFAKHQKKLAQIKLLEDEGCSVKEIHEMLRSWKVNSSKRINTMGGGADDDSALPSFLFLLK